MSLILQNIAKHITLSPEEEENFLSKIQVRKFKAKSILLNTGEICVNSYFVNSGILRSFNINDNIVEYVMSFAGEGYWIGDMYSLISQKPGNLFIEVLEDAEVVMLSKENQEILYTETPKLERFFRILIENSLVANQERLNPLDFFSNQILEFLENLIEKMP
ncbi:Crp/Fnr family transcriptional regulator [Flavobacterium sp. W22_SRS_FP1]|uniref:Crp/Fnr family transcriptional regulator n=1 Tax=Flavobacterium sp. W22_SRS_FP1 TaxID=3240276 RepID=UPI003F8EC02D